MLEQYVGIPFYTTYRIACAVICLVFIAKLTSDYPTERWPWIAVVLCALFSAGLFVTPIFDRPASRGEVMIFALPDAAIFLAARTVTYPVNDIHTRAVRQQLILGLVLAMAFCAILFSISLIPAKHR